MIGGMPYVPPFEADDFPTVPGLEGAGRGRDAWMSQQHGQIVSSLALHLPTTGDPDHDEDD